MTAINRQIVLKSNPSGNFSPDNFELKESSIPVPDEGEFLVRNLYLSLDPAMRIWAAPMDGYAPPVQLGEVMRGFTVSQVVESRHPDFSAGDIVNGMDGWQDYAVSNGVNYNTQGTQDTWNLKAIQAAGLPISTGVSVLGTTGLTGYHGIVNVGQIRQGDTVLISGAAGAVGSIAGQVARLKGAGRVVGTAGSEEKCRMLTDEFGYDAAINYKQEDLLEAFARECPDGVDIYFDNVGGPTLDAALAFMAMHGRVVLCGAISQYTSLEQGSDGPDNYLALLLKRGRMEGFIVLDHYPDLRAGMEAELIEWLKAGRMRYRDQEIAGLESAMTAINMLYDGRNTGKLLVKIAEPS
jgi:NADPH-dependent curcumin reductase CurA